VIVRDGLAIDALYSATCGGHTENVEVIFPLKRASYLKGVVCIEAGAKGLGGGVATASFPGTLLARAIPGSPPLPPAAGVKFDASTLERALDELAEAAGIEVPDDRLASLERSEVHRFLGSTFDLAADSRLFVLEEELDYLVAEPPPSWTTNDRRLAAYMVKSGLAKRDATTPLTAAESASLVLELAVFLRRVELRRATFEDLAHGEIVVRDEDSEAHFRLSPSVLTFRELGGETRSMALELVAGDDLDLYRIDGELAAVVQHVDARGAAFDRTHKRSSWTRFKSDEELRKAVANRLPGFVFESFEILTRGVSGRVGKIRLHSTTGEKLEVDGLPVRWTLDVPDTFFTARRLTPKNGPAGWQFSGRGWGHGVGLCQTGAYGMARRGHDAVSIVQHYYSGTKVEAVQYLP
jgi:stage II sporulation protein D